MKGKYSQGKHLRIREKTKQVRGAQASDNNNVSFGQRFALEQVDCKHTSGGLSLAIDIGFGIVVDKKKEERSRLFLGHEVRIAQAHVFARGRLRVLRYTCGIQKVGHRGTKRRPRRQKVVEHCASYIVEGHGLLEADHCSSRRNGRSHFVARVSSLSLFPDRRLHLMGLFWARMEAMQLVVCSLWRQVLLKGTEWSLGHKR